MEVADKFESIDNGRTCSICGRKLYDKRVYGNIIIPMKCECEIQKIKDEAAAILEQKKQERKELRIKRSKIPIKFQKKTFDNFEIRQGTEKSFSVAKEYAQRFPDVTHGILFIGGCGCGKTHIACAIGNELLERGYTVRFVVADDLYKAVLESYKSEFLTENQITRPYKECNLLIIDDVGTTPPTEKSKSVLHSVIDSRMNAELPTIITSNLKISELAEKLDSRTIDRIPEGFKTYINTAGSYRKKESRGET